MNIFKKVLVNETNLTRISDAMYGEFKNFPITCQLIDKAKSVSSIIIKIYCNSENEKHKSELNNYIHSLEWAKNGITEAEVNEYYCLIKISSSSVRKIQKYTESVITMVVEYLLSQDYKNGCEKCGSNESNAYYKINNSLAYTCDNCINKLQQEYVEMKEERKNEKSSIISGTFGAIIGAVIGGVIWVVLYLLGYLSSISTLIAITLSMKLYKKFGKYLDIKGVIISTLITIIVMYMANRLSYSILIYRIVEAEGYASQISFYEVFSKLFNLLERIGQVAGKNVDLVSLFYRDLFVGYFLGAIPAVFHIVAAIKEAKGNYKIVKLNR
ncbi:MAG: hypothetical protein J5507_04230 [Clostridia bacterium]|nr:hypothetical protein [Clostridia bacterium]